MNYIRVDNYVIKCRAYPTKEQAEQVDKILHGVRVAYNVTAYEITQGNPMVTKPDKNDETVLWPNFSGCMKKEWLAYLRDNYEAVKCVPSVSLSSSTYGIFGVDMKKSWENHHPMVSAKDKAGNQKMRNGKQVFERMNKAVKLPATKWKPDYYSKKKLRTSFTVQTKVSAFIFTEDSKAVRVGVTNVGKIKCRGWRSDILFGEDKPEKLFQDAFSKRKQFGVTVSKDNCGDYWIAVKLQTVWKPDKSKSNPVPIGVDVGIKDIAITSEGTKYENKKFKRSQKRRLRRLSRKVSRRQGWSNIEFREAHKKDKELTPSKNYNSSVLKKAKLERKIARQRDNWNHNVTADIVNSASFIGVEDLLVKGMMKNRHMAYSATDAAMGDVLQKLKYKAEWQRVPIQQIGRFEPSSQLCHVCGYRNRNVKNLSIRKWTCPECGSHHDRDINAAINIRDMALKTYENNAS